MLTGDDFRSSAKKTMYSAMNFSKLADENLVIHIFFLQILIRSSGGYWDTPDGRHEF